MAVVKELPLKKIKPLPIQTQRGTPPPPPPHPKEQAGAGDPLAEGGRGGEPLSCQPAGGSAPRRAPLPHLALVHGLPLPAERPGAGHR